MKKLHQVKTWGIDVGDVIFRNLPESMQVFHQQENSEPYEIAEHITLIPGVLPGLKMLVNKVGRDNVWLISKAVDNRVLATKLAFDKFKVFRNTGLKEDQVLFVPSRQDKSPVIKALELEGHIDDRGEIIFSVQKFVKCPLWFCPNSQDSDKWARQMNYSVRVVSGWKQIMEMYQ